MNMNNIRILDPGIASKIAAGEVVERPASVLKELMENALDAGATSIEVYAEDAGKRLIEVKDNGTGIAQNDIKNLFHRHATSKIQKIDDLYRITSLGFRGEALYSIGAISDIVLSTKTASQDTGWEIHVRAHQKLSGKPLPMNNGTHICVKELFFNTPARKKFLKSNSAELTRIIDVFLPYTLIYPGIRFILTHEKRKIIELKPADTLVQRIADSLHLEAKDILEAEQTFQKNAFSIRLALGDINIQRTRKDLQFIFINGRPVHSRTLAFHLNDVYRLLFSQGAFPFFCAYLSVPSSEVDVNIHPTKYEVKLKDEAHLISLLRSFAEQTLMTQSKAKRIVHTAVSFEPLQPLIPPFNPLQSTLSLEENTLLFRFQETSAGPQDTLKVKLQQSRYIGSLLKKFLLFESGDSLLVIDQHAAQERIVFERLQSQIEKGAIETQGLLTPLLIKITPQEMLLWEEYKDVLEKAGFSISLFDTETLAIHAYPQLIDKPENSVRTLLAGENVSKMDSEKIARLACRSSVMAGTELTKEQADYQQRQLLSCKNPFTCPHGRPTVIEIPLSHLEKQFLRK
jgi:DNA mismatch repair protein MutL